MFSLKIFVENKNGPARLTPWVRALGDKPRGLSSDPRIHMVRELISQDHHAKWHSRPHSSGWDEVAEQQNPPDFPAPNRRSKQ